MADTTEQDPSIEEILASIRQIISDDDVDSEEETSAPEPESEAPEEEPEEDIFQLTEEMQEEDSEPEPQAASIDFQAQEDENDEIDIDAEETDIFTEPAAAATVGGFKTLSDKVALANYSDNVTLEEIVKDMLRPMLREWIDSNMPQIVEVLVEKELEKLARHAKDS